MAPDPGIGARRRLGYLARRARFVDPANVWRIATAAKPLTRKPRLVIVGDMLWSSIRHETAFQDYLDWDFVTLTRAERRTYMTHPKSNHLVYTLNDPAVRPVFADKIRFNTLFADYVGRDWIDLRTTDVAGLREFVTRYGRVMVKVPDSLSGHGIAKRDAASVADWGAFRAELLEAGQFLVEEFIEQHAVMASLCPTSVNSLRMITYLDRGADAGAGRVHLLASVLKIGNGGDIDNFSGGGMYTMVDDAGVALYPAFDGTGQTYAVHPLTGTPIVGFQVPEFPAVLEMLDRASRLEPAVPYVGWDIAITPTGPVIIEGNPNSGVFQAKPSVSGVRTGLLPKYRAAIGF